MTTANDETEIEASRAPLVEHLIELRQRLLYSVIALLVLFVICFYFAQPIFNILTQPYNDAAGGLPEFIFTSPQEWFFTQMKVAFFAALFLSFPVIASQLYMFIAPGLYKNERGAFLPYLVATPILFLCGALLVYFVIMPLALSFFLGLEQSASETQAAITHLPKVSEYLGLVMTLIFAFGLVFQLPVVLTLLGRAGLVTSESLVKKWKYAIVITFIAAAVLTPPDPVSQIGLAVPSLLLYQLSIWSVKMIERRREREEAERASA